MTKPVDKRQMQREFAGLDYAARRAIVKAVNRGRAVEVRRHAPLAVSVAQRQIRFWRWAWLIGPGIGAVQLAFAPPEIALFNALIATLILFMMAFVLIRRAQRSIVANQAIVQGRVGPPTRGRSSRLPRARSEGATGDKAVDAATDSPTTPAAGAPRPPAPRGRKRRR